MISESNLIRTNNNNMVVSILVSLSLEMCFDMWETGQTLSLHLNSNTQTEGSVLSSAATEGVLLLLPEEIVRYFGGCIGIPFIRVNIASTRTTSATGTE